MSLIVAKLGSSTLVNCDGTLDTDYIEDFCEQVASLMDAGHQVIIVSSGAVAAGMRSLGFEARPCDMPSLQACAAAGQAALTNTYAKVLATCGHACGQVLLTRRDVIDRDGYLNARNTLARLLSLGAVPVVNENDTVSTAEFAFGDNDMLGAIVAALVHADLYVILSDIAGLYTADPRTNSSAVLLTRVERVDTQIVAMAGGVGSQVGTGGMATKLRAARAMLAAGIPMVVCDGHREGVLCDVVAGVELGTRFEAPPGSHVEGGLKLWIGLAEVAHGSLTIDDGAVRAVCERGASVLPVGITAVSGNFSAGDVVDLMAADGTLIGRGICRYSADEILRVHGLKLDVIARFMPEHAGQPAIHRDELLVL